MRWKDTGAKQKELARKLSEMKFGVDVCQPIRGKWQIRMPFLLRGSIAQLKRQATIVDIANCVGVRPAEIAIGNVPLNAEIGNITNFDILLDTQDRRVVKVENRPSYAPPFITEHYETKRIIPPYNKRESNPMAFWVGVGFSGWVSVQINTPSENHLLVTGTSGSGKSVLLFNILDQLVDRDSDNISLHVVDPNRVLSIADHLPHLANERAQNVESGRQLIVNLAGTLEKINGQHYHLVIVDELSAILKNAPADVNESWDAICKRGRGLGMYVVAATQKALAENVGSEARAQLLWRAVGSYETEREFRMHTGDERAIPHLIPGAGCFYIYRIAKQHGVNIRVPYLDKKYLDKRFKIQPKVVEEVDQLPYLEDMIQWVKTMHLTGVSQNDIMLRLRDEHGQGTVRAARDYKEALIEKGVIERERNYHKKHSIRELVIA
jgi:energy-coupling factor transporter ATP-binding protein EcfA2